MGNGDLQIAAAIVLPQLLAPEDFGLVAIVTVLTSFAQLVFFRLGDAITQNVKTPRLGVPVGSNTFDISVLGRCNEHWKEKERLNSLAEIVLQDRRLPMNW
jgi:hypothetical protein